MEFETLLKELKKQLTLLFGEKYQEFGLESKRDIEAFLTASQKKLERWTVLLADGDLSPADFEWLIKSQKDLLALKALEQAGVSKISLGHFKNNVLKTIFDIVLTKIV